MFRVFNLPLTSSYATIFQLLVTNGFCDSLGNMLVSSAKNSAIIPDRVMELDVRPGDANAGDTTYRDIQADPGTEPILSNMSKRSNRNTISLKDYEFASSADPANDTLVVEIEAA